MPQHSTLKTYYAPAERAPETVIKEQYISFQDTGCSGLVDAIPVLVLVLNKFRQTVFANKRLREYTGKNDMDEFLGQRPGELFNCEHSREGEGGCGTSRFCRYCGAVNSILESQKGHETTKTCSLTRRSEYGLENLDLSVTSVPYVLGKETFTVFTIRDVSAENRRNILERTFFHDVLNTSGGVQGLLTHVVTVAPESIRETLEIVLGGVKKMVNEIQMQKDVALAEQGELSLRPARTDAGRFVSDIAEEYGAGYEQLDRQVSICADACETSLTTDPIILGRVLGNMIKNAVEASPKGGLVMVGCTDHDDAVTFWVNNAGVISESARYRVFSRSFSTKGHGRGLGTYSMRLLTERYLGGTVDFSSNEEDGTTFTVTLPKEMPAPADHVTPDHVTPDHGSAHDTASEEEQQ